MQKSMVLSQARSHVWRRDPVVPVFLLPLNTEASRAVDLSPWSPIVVNHSLNVNLWRQLVR